MAWFGHQQQKRVLRDWASEAVSEDEMSTAGEAAAPPSLGSRMRALTLPAPTVIQALPGNVADLYHSVDAAYAARNKCTNARCILCRYGHRVVDAGGDGSKLYSELINLIEKRFPSMKVEELVDMIERWVELKIRPALREAGHEQRLPLSVDRAALIEHFSTSQHSKNSHLFCCNAIGFLERVRLRMADFIFPKVGSLPPCHRPLTLPQRRACQT
jgi:hypothetical protein